MTSIAYPPPRRGRSPLQSSAWAMSALGLALFGGWFFLSTSTELRRALQVPPTPPDVARDVVVRNVPDLSGRVASFRILLLSDQFRWQLNSVDRLEDMSSWPLFSPEIQAALNKAAEIVCVGASSEELPVGFSEHLGRLREERRAARRAGQIAAWVRDALAKEIPVRKLNIGHHVFTGQSGDTADQRRVVIILVLERSAGVNIDEALRAAMSRESWRVPVFHALLTQYSLSPGPGFTWVP